ncbi:MAG: nuclear transport factor 2 family protein [Chloroflexi bacterium]|nr:nuclear transport factor 2 family protein [Chloroflexota bacterium]
MADKAAVAREYLEKSMAGDVDGVLALVTDDIVLNRGMMGAVSGKDGVAEAIRGRPMAAAGIAPTFESPVEAGEQIKIKGNLPPGSPFPISSLTWTFSFANDKISRIEIGF